jgi:hypothetical protein
MATSCTSPSEYPWGIQKTRGNLNNLEVGMTKDQVIAVMGRPHTREVFPDETGHSVEVLIYITEYTDAGSIPDSDKTPICLRDGKVTGWGRNFYDRTQKHDITIRQR